MKLAIFDYDGTLFTRDTLPFLFSQWKEQNYSKLKLIKAYFPLIYLYLRYKLGNKSLEFKEQMKTRAVKEFNGLFKGMSKEQITEFFHEAYEAGKPFYNQLVLKKLSQAQKDGYYTLLLSGAYQLYLENAARDFVFDAVIGTEIPFKNGLFDTTREIKVISGPLKVENLKKHIGHMDNKKIDWANSLAYADSAADIPLLEVVGQPVAVNPDEGLEITARQRGWKILSKE